MSERKDILDGTKDSNLGKKYGLIYTCNCGWVDLGHLNPDNKRKEIGATNLWKQINDGGKNGKSFFVCYRQDHGKMLWGAGKEIGREGIYIVKPNLSLAQKKSVALAIFMKVSNRFEYLQKIAGTVGLTDSGYSQEDLVSNLIGFYIAVGEVNRLSILKKCHPVSIKTAYSIWDSEGPVGKNKNSEWKPKYARNISECANQPKQFPNELQKIKPASKGTWYSETSTPVRLPCRFLIGKSI